MAWRTFRVTIQNHSDQEFSYRPKSVWAEIVPVLPSGEEKPGYTFYDLCFENGCEVPKLEFRAGLARRGHQGQGSALVQVPAHRCGRGAAVER